MHVFVSSTTRQHYPTTDTVIVTAMAGWRLGAPGHHGMYTGMTVSGIPSPKSGVWYSRNSGLPPTLTTSGGQAHDPLDPRPVPGHRRRRRRHLPQSRHDRPGGAQEPCCLAEQVPRVGARDAPPHAVAEVARGDGRAEARAQVHLEEEVRVVPGGEALGVDERRPDQSG
ncbi:hypothetical protein BS78_K197300 [Paspalum vaginatum]|uniref:Uncharacterized protein n=1 Tax=Paspalum vaginatum TaxID=158149 RepID=A0A9W7XEP8_9POAL|nr:hypothetical protein BS78_K197300 [Paspalum vaginatum]